MFKTKKNLSPNMQNLVEAMTIPPSKEDEIPIAREFARQIYLITSNQSSSCSEPVNVHPNSRKIDGR